MGRFAAFLASQPAFHSPAAVLALGQGLYYVVTALWSLIHLGSFLKVTGPKTDIWLVKTVGGFLAVIGAGLALAGARRRVTPEITLVAAGSAVVLSSVDVVYATRGRISPVYLADALVEVLLAAAWAALWLRGRLGL